MADYSYIDFDKFEPTKYPNWGYQNTGRSETIIYYPTGEVWELGELKGWHDNASFDIVVFFDADVSTSSKNKIVDYMYGASTSDVDEAIDYLSYQLGYDLG